MAHDAAIPTAASLDTEMPVRRPVPPVALIPPPDLDQVGREFRAEYEAGRERHSHFDELRMILLRFPAALRAADGMYDLIMERGLLDRYLKEAIFVTCSGVRGCGYALAAHGRWLTAHARMAPSEVEALGQGADLARHSESDRILLEFARKVAAAPYRTLERDVEALRTAGFDERTIVETLTVVSLSGWMNGYAAALGLDAGDVSSTIGS